jgi:hypothetical protein
MYTVKVIYKDNGKPAKDKRVCVGYDGFGRGVTKEQWTDSDGEAHFDYDNGKGDIFVNGKTVYKGKIEGRMVVYI